MGTNVGEVLGTLKQALRDISPSSGSSQAQENWAQGPSNKQLLLQISAIHKGLLALSDAFLENIEAARQQAAAWEGGLEGVRRELLGRVEVAAEVHRDLQMLATLEAGLTEQNAMLMDRVGALEESTASLHAAVEQAGAEAAQTARNEATRAANAHFEEHLAYYEAERLTPLAAAAVAQQAQQWAAAELAGLVREEVQRQVAAAVQEQLRAMQAGVEAAREASASAAEAAAQAAADAASLAGEVRHLASWCEQVDAAHANHEERLRRLEAAEAGTARPALERAGSSPGGARELSPRLEQLEGALQEQDARLGRLEAAASAVAPPAGPGTVRSPGASPDAGAAAAAAGAVPGAPSLTAVHSRLGQLEGALAEVGQQATQQAARLEEVAAAQAQQGRGTEELLHSMLTDVMALARHTKALDGEVRALRSGVGQVQDALLRSSSAFAKATGIPSPLGPFTSFPPGGPGGQ